MAKEIVLSICIPTYSRAERVFNTIKTILEYPEEDIEIVVANDTSVDDTVERLEQISDKRLRVINNEKNLGQRENQIKVLFAARGKYTLVLLDRDSIILQRFYILMENLRNNEETPILLLKEKKEEWNSKWRKNIYHICSNTHPSDIIYHSGMLRNVCSYESIKKTMRLDENPFVYFPPIVGISLFLRYEKCSTSQLDLARYNIVGTKSGDFQRNNSKCTDFYLPIGAWKRLKIWYRMLEAENRRKREGLFPYLFAIELTLATMGNFYLSENRELRLRTGVVRMSDEAYRSINRKMCDITIKYLRKRRSLSVRQYVLIRVITALNNRRLIAAIQKNDVISSRIWEYLF